MRIGEILKEYRERNNLKRWEVAKKLSTDPQHLYQVEKNLKGISVEKIMLLAKVSGWTLILKPNGQWNIQK